MVQIDRQIEELLEGIDFDKLHSIYEFLHWEWKNYAIPYVPSKMDLREEIISLAKHLLKDPQASMTCRGGLCVEKDDHNTLHFVLVVECIKDDDYD